MATINLTDEERRFLAASAKGHGGIYLAERFGGTSNVRALRRALAEALGCSTSNLLARAFEMGLVQPGIDLA